MNANPVLLQKKYARIVEKFAEKTNITLKEALDIFYHSKLYELMSEGVSDMHCMSDDYLVQELADEQAEKEELKAIPNLRSYAIVVIKDKIEVEEL